MSRKGWAPVPVAVALLVHCPSIFGEFVYDDQDIVTGNELV